MHLLSLAARTVSSTVEYLPAVKVLKAAVAVRNIHTCRFGSITGKTLEKKVTRMLGVTNKSLTDV